MAGMFEKPRPWWHGANVLRVTLGLVFLFAGLMKLIDMESFHRDVLAYQILLKQPSGWIAITLPVLETLVGLLLVTGLLRAGCYVAIILMSAVFGLLHTYTIQRGLNVDCGCFGAVSLSSPVMLALNIILLLVALWLLLDDLRRNVVEKPKYRLSSDLMRKKRY
jgi:uncharacterized membrane protein YphA (DoxX/SURF4 family)